MAPKFSHKVHSKVKSIKLSRAIQVTLIAMITSLFNRIRNVRNIKSHQMNIFWNQTKTSYQISLIKIKQVMIKVHSKFKQTHKLQFL